MDYFVVMLLKSSETSASLLLEPVHPPSHKSPPPLQLALPNPSFKDADPTKTIWVCSLIYIIFASWLPSYHSRKLLCSQSKWHQAILGKSPSDLSVSRCIFWRTPNTTDHRSSHSSREQPFLDGVTLHCATMNKSRISLWIPTPASGLMPADVQTLKANATDF